MNTTVAHSMPIPGTSEAPKFDGHYLSDFIEDLELHFQRAGVTDEDRQVNFITRYSTDKIRKQIGFLPELDRSKKNKTWAAAKTVLTEFYGDVDKPRPLSLAEFQAWVQSSADKPAFVSKDQVNKYYAEFMSKGRPLLDNKQVSDNDLNFAFIQGCPRDMKAALRGLIPEANRTRHSPLEIKKTLEYLRSLANKDDPTYEAWRYEEIAAEDTLVPALPEDQDNSTSNRANTPAATTSGKQVAKSSPQFEDEMRELMKQFSEMKIMLAQAQVNQMNQQNRPQRCAMCSAVNPGHTMRTCPEAAKLVAEGRIRLDTGRNRYVLTTDNSELPRIPYGYEGGIAAFLRAQMPIPPTTHATHVAGLVFENGAIFSTLTNPPHAHPALRGGKEYENRFDPRKRPNDKPSARQRTQDNNPPAPSPAAAPPPPALAPRVVAPPQQPPTQAPAPASVPEPPNAINRKDGWKQSQPKAKGKEVRYQEDVVMRDGSSQPQAKQPAPISGYKHITDLEAQVSSKDVLAKILQDVSVTLPLGQILGTSASLQDLVHEATRRRRVPKDANGQTSSVHAVLESSDDEGSADVSTSHVAAASLSVGAGVLNSYAVQVSHLDASGVPLVEAEYTTGSSYGDYVLVHDGQEVSQQQLAFSTFPISRTKHVPSIPDRMFAMATGVFTLKVNGKPFRGMVDTGSELNVTGRNFPDLTRLPLDSLGEYWQLKGIHGGAEKLAGYIDRVPFQIGRHTFEHHVFVSPHETIGDSFDLILGQPFLTYFDARVEYSATGETVLYLWADRDKEFGQRPTLGISITDPEDVRNKKEIVARLHTTALQQAAASAAAATASLPPSAMVEEVADEDYYEDYDGSGF